MRRPDERGSLPVVVAILTVVALFVTVLVSGVLGDMITVNHDSDIEAARALAQSGISDALFRIDQMGDNTSSFCVGAASWCTVSSVPGAPGASYAAVVNPDDPNSYVIESEGTVKGIRYAVQADISRIVTFPTAAFAGSGITINGSNSNINYVDNHGNVVDSANIGSDGTITCHGSGTFGKQQVTYGSGGTSNCPNWVNSTATYAPQQPLPSCPPPLPASTPPTPCMGSPAQACPGTSSGGTWTIGSSTSTTTLEPGIYDCVGNVTLVGTVNVDYGSTANNGQVQIFAFPPSGSTSMTVDFSSCSCNLWENQSASPPVIGDPTVLQVLAAGSGNANLKGAVADAVLYAPGLNADVHGASLTWDGTLVVNTLTVDGGPDTIINYDQRMATLIQSNWQVSNYAQLAPASFSLALS